MIAQMFEASCGHLQAVLFGCCARIELEPYGQALMRLGRCWQCAQTFRQFKVGIVVEEATDQSMQESLSQFPLKVNLSEVFADNDLNAERHADVRRALALLRMLPDSDLEGRVAAIAWAARAFRAVLEGDPQNTTIAETYRSFLERFGAWEAEGIALLSSGVTSRLARLVEASASHPVPAAEHATNMEILGVTQHLDSVPPDVQRKLSELSRSPIVKASSPVCPSCGASVPTAVLRAFLAAQLPAGANVVGECPSCKTNYSYPLPSLA